MNIIFWSSSTSSGLCDRLIDLFLMSAYAKIKKSNLYLQWQVVHRGNIYEWQLNDNQSKKWDDIRYEDYLYSNLITYFTLPKNIFVDKQIPESVPVEYFHEYLGGVYSPYSFYDKFLKNEVSINLFLKKFFESLSEFKPTNKLIELCKNTPYPDLTVHLRRADKVRLYNDDHSINYRELELLNENTIKIIDSLISKNNNLKIYFCSDDLNEMEKYNKKYNKNIIDRINVETLIERTYVDVYIMSNSDSILMSQKHSSFSLFSSLINQKKLIYLYDECPIVWNGYSELGFFHNAKTLF